VAKKSIAPNPPKVKPAFKLSEARKAELQRTYDRLIDRAKGRVYVRGIHDNHHILPKSLGGSNAKSNIAILTYDEHFLAHRLLTKLTTGVERISMLHALERMTRSTKNSGDRIFSGWQYALARKAKSDAMIEYFATGGRKTQSETRKRYFLKPGVIEEFRAARNTLEAKENARQGANNRYAKPGSREISSEAAFRRFSQPGAKEALREAKREKNGKPVENVTLGLVFRSMVDAQEYFGNVHGPNIRACCLGTRKTEGGYVWRFITKEEYHERKNSQNPTLLPQKSEL
jgi:hypothetical protein